MAFVSPSPSSNGSEPTCLRPSSRKDFQIAIICALPLEYDAAMLTVDEFWDQDGKQYGRTSGDTNFYRNGRIGMHNVVLMLLPNMGKAAVAGSAASLRATYSNLKIAFLVGVCGGVPILDSHEAFLGDVIIGEAIIQYDFGRQYPGEFIPKEEADATRNVPNKEIRSLLAYFKSETGNHDLRRSTASHLKTLQDTAGMKHRQRNYCYPGLTEDKLFVATYRHKHRENPLCVPCCNGAERYCHDATQSSCAELGCNENKLVQRQRLKKKRHLEWEKTQCPDIFIGRVASADTVMKSGDHRDQIAKQYNIIAFEMEGAGLWDEAPCIVVKGICDYADSHKNKIWQPFAAATAAAVVKAILVRYTLADHIQLSASSPGEIESLAISNDDPSTTLDSGRHNHIPPTKLQVTPFSRRNLSSASFVVIAQRNGAQTLRDAIFDFQKALTDDQRRELQRIKAVPDADAVLIFTAELDTLNRNRKGRSIASRLHSVLQSVRDFSAAMEAFDSTQRGTAPTLWGSVKLTMIIAVKFFTYYETLSKFFMDLGAFCPRWTDYQIFYSYSPRLQNALYDFYGSLIRCFKRAIETVCSWSTYLFISSRESFERDFQQDAENIKRCSKQVTDALSHAKKEADYQNQQLQSIGPTEFLKKKKTISIFRRKENRPDKMESWQAQRDARQAKERRQRLLDSLSTYDYLNPFKQSRRKRYSGTLEWLFQTHEFDWWINSTDFSLLWCSGKIGSGKTILTSSVIDKLLIEKRSSDTFISFFFVRFDDRESSNAEVILKSIILQILDVSGLSEEVETLLEQMHSNLASGLDEISELLQRIVATFKTVYIVIDGLDECEKQDRHDLLEVLSSVATVRPNTKLFLAGRDSVSREVQRKFPTLKQLAMNCLAAQSDIAAYVEGIVQEKLQTEELIVGDPDLIEDIKMALSEGANGMFLWVAFQVDELSLQHCDDDIRKAIQNLPKDLEETFDRAIDRIIARGNENIAKQVFQWVAAAREPLSLDQLREAVFIEIGQQYSKTERRSNGIDHISSWCENLVQVDEELRTVQFAHQTVQQFFFEKSPDDRHYQFYLKLEDADHYLGEICVTYLNFNDFKTTLALRQQPLPPMPPVAMVKTALGPQWKAATSISTLWKFNLDTRGGSVAANAVEALASFQRDNAGEAKERLYRGHPFLRYASIHWIFHTRMFQKAKSKTWKLWAKMVFEGHDLVTKPWDEDRKNILEWGHKFHHHALLRLLIYTDMIVADDKNQIFLDAATGGDIALLNIFLEVEDADLEMSQACLAAARGGQILIIKRLLEAGVDDQIAIRIAAQHDDQKAIGNLLAASIDSQTALWAAVQRGNQVVVRSLLDAGLDGQVALRVAAQHNDQGAIRSLLSAGIDGQTALRTAAQHGDQEAIRSLLAARVGGQTAIEGATQRGDREVLTNLLAAGVDGQVALQAAAKRGDHEMIRIILAAGVNVNSKSGGRTALYTAARNGREGATVILLAAGADANIKCGGRTALQAADISGHHEIVSRLEEAGALM